MANYTVKDFIEQLTNLNNIFRGVSESIKNLEENELELYKTNTELKYSLLKELGEVSNSFKQFGANFSQALMKLDFHDDKVTQSLQEIKELIKNTEPIEITDDRCKNCSVVKEVKDANTVLISEKEKWSKRLWIAVIFLGITVLSLLGLNVTNVIKLSNIVTNPTSIIQGP